MIAKQCNRVSSIKTTVNITGNYFGSSFVITAI